MTPEIDLDEDQAELAEQLRQAVYRAVEDDRMTWLVIAGEHLAAIVPTYAGSALGDAQAGYARTALPRRPMARKSRQPGEAS